MGGGWGGTGTWMFLKEAFFFLESVTKISQWDFKSNPVWIFVPTDT